MEEKWNGDFRQELVRQIVAQVMSSCTSGTDGGQKVVPAQVSARHVHLSRGDADALFGAGYQLRKKKDISQPGQYICEERLTVIGPKGQLSNVAVLGPLREKTQAEFSLTDGRALGLDLPVKMSGDLSGAADLWLMNGANIIKARGAAIAAKNHVHMTEADAARMGISKGQTVTVKMQTARPLSFEGVAVRISPDGALAFHMDTDEANACGFQAGCTALLLTDSSRVEAESRGPSVEIASTAFSGETGGRESFEGRLLSEQAVLGLSQHTRILSLRKGTVVTPMAKDALRQKKIELCYL